MRIILLVFLLAFCPCDNSLRNGKVSATPENSEFGTLVVSIAVLKNQDGSPLDESDSPYFRIFVANKNGKKEIPYTKDGKYHAEIKKGVYKIFLTDLNEKEVSFKRANFVVHNGETTNINLLIPGPLL